MEAAKNFACSMAMKAAAEYMEAVGAVAAVARVVVSGSGGEGGVSGGGGCGGDRCLWGRRSVGWAR